MTRAPRPCAQPGCPTLVRSGSRCPEHPNPYDQGRGSAARRGYGRRWSAYSKRYLQENPFCATCRSDGKQAQAHHVDHITPVTGPDDPLFWEPNNHQGLCRTHHNRKTASERGQHEPNRGEKSKPKELVWA